MNSRDWKCPDCGNLCFADKKECFKCGKWKPPQRKPGDWECEQCHKLNFARRSTCMGCGTAKAPQPQPNLVRPKEAPRPRPGDWRCHCGENNFGSRVVCRECGEDRPVAGAKAEKEDESKCKVCFEKDKDVKLPCGHYGLCIECAKAYDKCPFCRLPYEEKQIEKVFSI